MNDISWDIKLPNMLCRLPGTPYAATNKSPVRLFMNRRLHTFHDTDIVLSGKSYITNCK